MALGVLTQFQCTGTDAGTETETNRDPNFVSVDQYVGGDDHSDYDIPAPSSDGQYTYSKELWIRWKLTGLPDNYIENLKAYGPNHQPDHEANPANKIIVMWGTTGSGATPTSNASTVATTPQHSNYYDVANSLAIGVVPVDGLLDAIGEKSEYLVAQLKIAYDVAQGTGPVIPFSLDYDEL